MAAKRTIPGKARAPKNEGWPPDEDAKFTVALDGLLTPGRKGDRRPRPYVSPSNAGKCARALGYHAIGLEQEPPDLASEITFALGDALHDTIQGAFANACDDDGTIEIGGVRSELHIEWPIGTPGDGERGEDGEVPPIPQVLTFEHRGDTYEIPVFGYIDVGHHETSVDIKSKGGYGYKLAIGERKAADGPDVMAMVQALIGAMAKGLKFGTIIMGAKDAISKTSAAAKRMPDAQRVVAEWTIALEDWRDFVQDELVRMWKINELARSGTLPARRIPGYAGEVENPGDGTVNGTGLDVAPDGTVLGVFDAWQCAYCGYRDRCIADGPGRVTITPPTTQEGPNP